MPDQSQQITLGTFFTADTTQLVDAVRQIESVLGRLNRAMSDMASKAGSVTGTISSIGNASANAAPGTEKSAKAIREYDKALEGVAKRGRAFAGAFESVAAGINKNSAAQHDVANAVVETERALSRVRSQFGAYLENVKGVARGTKEFNSEMSRLRESSIMPGQQGAMLGGATMARYTGSIGESRKALSNWIAAQSNATKAFKDFDKAIAAGEGRVKGMSGLLADMGYKLRNLGEYAVAATAIYGVFDALRAGTGEIINFNQALKNIEAISGAAGYEIDAMSKIIKDIARETKFSTVELAEGMVVLQQTGLTTAEALDSIGAVANLATGTLSDMSTSTDLLTTSLRAFGEHSSNASKISDIWANAINKSKLTIDKLRIALNYVGVAASQSNIDIEETAASFMLLANNGLRASTIGTGLRQVFSKMVNPTEKLKEALEGQGKSVEEINPRLVGYRQAMENLSDVLWDSEKRSVRMGDAFKAFGLRGASAAATLVKSFKTGGDYDDALQKVYEVGTAAGMSAIQQEGLAVKFKNLADRAKVVAVEIGESGLSGAMHLLIDMLKKAVAFVEALAKSPIAKTILQVSALVGAMAALKSIVSSFSSAQFLKNYLFALQSMGTSQAALKIKTDLLTASTNLLKSAWAVIQANPFLTAVAGAAALVLVLKKAVEWNDKMAKAAAEQSVEYRRAYDVLAAYVEKIKEAEGSSVKYHATVTRLKKEQREYADEVAKAAGVVDISTLSHDQLVATMERVSQSKMEKSIQEKGKALRYMSADVAKATLRMAYWDEALQEGKVSYEEYAEKTKGFRETLKTYDNLTRDLVLSLRDQMDAQAITRDEAEKLIDTIARSGPAAEQMKNMLGQAMSELNTQYVGKLKNSYIELFDIVEDKVSALGEKYDELKSKIDKVNDEIASEEKSYQDDIRDIRRRTLTDEEKWLDDRKEANRLLNEGLAKQDEEMLKKSQKLFKSLAREVRNESGTVVKEIDETARVAEEGMSRAHSAIMSSLEGKKKAFEEDAKTIKEQIDAANGKLDEFKDKIKELSTSKMTIDTSEAKKQLEDLRKEAERLKKQIASSGKSSSGGSGSPSSSAFNTGGRVFQGMNPPGIDTIPARLTVDEFVEPVRSTRKYSFPFMEGLRRLAYPVENIKAVMAAGTRRFSDIFKRAPKFFDGGQVTFTPPPPPTFRNYVPAMEKVIARGYEAGGRASQVDISGLENFGQFELSVAGGGKFKAIAMQDPLKAFQAAYERQMKRRTN